MLRDYIRVLGLKKGDFLFPRVFGSRVKDKHRCVTYAISYKWLQLAKNKLDLEDGLTWHCFRIGAANRGSKLGVSRGIIKEAGFWRSEAVDLYIRQECPGLVLSEALLRDGV